MSPWFGFKERELTPELMDDFALDLKSHIDALQGLERINQASLAAVPVWKELKKYFLAGSQKSLRILDIACGGGDLVLALAAQACKENLPFIFEGCDFNPRAVEYARFHAQKKNLSVDYFIFDVLKNTVPERFDIVINSLFLHHLNNSELVLFFNKLRQSAVKFIIVSDLKRSFAGWLLAHGAGRILSRSPVVHIDGPRSVRAAFTPGEILRFACNAGFSTAYVRPIWPVRFLLTLARS